MATTTNYGWTTPDDTDLVKDGAAAIRTLGSSVDTTTKNLNPETTLGDLSFRSATSNVNTRIPIGSSGQHLTVVAGVPAWSTASDQTPLTTKGDLFTFSTVDARLPVGTNGQVLTADSSEATGLKFATPAGGSFAGVRLYRNGYLTLANNTNTLLNWDTESYDVGGYASSGSTITIPAGKAGYYFISTQTTYDPSATGYRGLFIKQNGNTIMQSYIYTPPSGAYPYITVNYVAYCAVADTIETYAQQTSGGNLQVYLGATDSFLLVSYLGA